MTFALRTLTSGDATAAFRLATEIFARDSSLHRALGVDLDAYRRHLRPSFDRMVRENLSLIAEDEDGTLLGCIVVTDFANLNVATPLTSPPFDAIEALTARLAAPHAAKHPGEAALVDMAVVSDGARGTGVYGALRAEAEVRARRKGFQRILGELSSAATQHVVLNRMGHRALAEIAFDQFRHNGTYPFAEVNDPASIILSEKRL